MADLLDPLEGALSAYVREPWTDSQHRRVRQQLEAAVDGNSARRPQRALWMLVPVALVVLVLGAAVGRPGPVQSLPRRGVAVIRAGSPALSMVPGVELGEASQEAQGLFADGSLVRVAQAGKVRVLPQAASETRLEVVAGRAAFEIQKQQGRAFIAMAHGVEVRVVGTRFEVELKQTGEPCRVRVSVVEGVVEVKQNAAAAAVRLVAGQTLELNAPADSGPERDKPATPRLGASSAPAVRAIAGDPDAASLFQLAGAARTAGRARDAAQYYEALLSRFPSDERAGVAALELGRLRMDAEHNPLGAIVALRRAVQTAPNEGLREDASARLVEALGAMNHREECRAARSQYLLRYPNSVHAAAVRARCGGQ